MSEVYCKRSALSSQHLVVFTFSDIFFLILFIYFYSDVNDQCFDAFNYGRREEALRLLKKVKEPLKVTDSSNFTLLHCAAYHGWLDVVKQLIIEHQFNPDCKDDDGNTPLTKAIGNGKDDVVEYLTTGESVFMSMYCIN